MIKDELDKFEKLLNELDAKHGIGLGTPEWKPKRRPKTPPLQKAGADFRSTTWEDLKVFIDPIEWDWEGWLPRGFLIVLASEPGLGKSMLALRVVGCYLAGMDWPDGRPFTGKRGKVIWCEGEASQALNLARAEALDLELADIVSPLPHPLEGFRLDDEKHVLALIHLCRRPETRLVVMDSLSSLVVGGPTASGGSNLSVRGIPRALNKLGEIARITQQPILLTHHLRKRTRLDRDGLVDLQRLRGTSKIGQAARVVWTLDVPNLTDRENRRLAVVKNNLMSPPGGIGMRIGEKGLVFGEAPVAPAMVKKASQVEMGMGLLVGLLGEGPRKVREIEGAFLEAGMSRMTMRRAKEALGVVSYKVRGEKGWWWKKKGGNNE